MLSINLSLSWSSFLLITLPAFVPAYVVFSFWAPIQKAAPSQLTPLSPDLSTVQVPTLPLLFSFLLMLTTTSLPPRQWTQLLLIPPYSFWQFRYTLSSYLESCWTGPYTVIFTIPLASKPLGHQCRYNLSWDQEATCSRWMVYPATGFLHPPVFLKAPIRSWDG